MYRVQQRNLNLPERSEEHTSELQSQSNLVCRLLLEKKKITNYFTSMINKVNPKKIPKYLVQRDPHIVTVVCQHLCARRQCGLFTHDILDLYDYSAY